MAHRRRMTPDFDQDNRSQVAGFAMAGALLLVLAVGVALIIRSLLA